MGFLRALFDFSFSEFVTTRLIRLLYVVGLLIAFVVTLSAIAAGFNESPGAGIISLIFAPLLFLIVVIVARIYLELVIVIFRIAEHLRDISRNNNIGRPD